MHQAGRALLMDSAIQPSILIYAQVCFANTLHGRYQYPLKLIDIEKECQLLNGGITDHLFHKMKRIMMINRF